MYFYHYARPFLFNKPLANLSRLLLCCVIGSFPEEKVYMDKIRLPIGITDFKEIRGNGYHYIDKTASIKEIIEDYTKASLMIRPRRFGKTTFQQMLRAFFDIREDNRDIFEGLAIMDDKEAVEGWMNKYPVIHLSFLDVDRLTFNSALTKIRSNIKELFLSYDFIDDGSLEANDSLAFKSLLSASASADEISLSLRLLARLLFHHYGKKVIFLLDEYDVPLSKAEKNGYYDEMLDLIRSMFISVLKDCPYTEKGILTGCLRLPKESIFTGLNNLVVYSVAGKKYADTFGFTGNEVAKLLVDTGFEDKAGIVKEWYDGYSIGGQDLYTPWDVLSYVADLQADRNFKPQNYWTNSTGDDDVRRLIDMTNATVSRDYSTLLSGGVVRKEIIETLTYRNLYSSSENVWSLLFMTGYLTLAGPYQPNGETELRIPNEEVKSIFKTSVDGWFSDYVKKSDRKPLFNALWSGDADSLSSIISRYLRQTISYHDYNENYYHAFLAGILAAGDEYTVTSNRESGTGRADLIVSDSAGGRVAVIEVKHSSSVANMEKDAQKALAQIEKRQYGQDFTDYTTVLKYGAAFFSKSVIFKSAE